VRLRLEGGSGRALNSSFETPLAAAPQDEAERDDRDHGPGHSLPSWPGLSRPSRSSEVLRFTDRDHRDEPGDDGEGEMVCTHFALDTVYHLGSTRAHPGPTGARSRGVADVGRGAVLQQASHAGWREALGSPVLVQVETPNSPACEASWLFPFHHSHRAGLPSAPSSINYTARSASCGPAGPCLVQSHCFRRKRQYSQVQVNTMIVSTNG
jgi:hypothetical protein